jgi:hypothetical protein
MNSSKDKGKGKVVLVLSFLTEHHPMKANWGRGGTDPCILDLGTRYCDERKYHSYTCTTLQLTAIKSSN